MIYEYRWRTDVPVSGSFPDPGKFAEELERIESVYGRVTAEGLVKEAKAKGHIAHDFIFHVSQKDAARIHYEERGRLLLRSLHVVSLHETPRTTRARIVVDDPAGERRYAATQEVAGREDLRDRHRASLLRRMNMLRQELIDFDEFSEVVSAITKVLEAA